MSLFKRKEWPVLGIDILKKKARLLVVDDQDFPYEPLFKKDGYAIDKWDDVEDLNKIEQGMYDVILLDIQGVGKTYSSEQGLGLLKYIKEKSVTQMVIAYSDGEWNLKYQKFFDLADDKLDKSDDYYNFKIKVNECIIKRYKYDFFYNKIISSLEGEIEISDKLKKIVKKSIIDNKPEKLKNYLDSYNVNQKSVSLVVSICDIAIKVFNICMSLA